MQYQTTIRWAALSLVALALVGSTACHRVIIDSGLEPAAQVHHEEWNMAYASAIYPAKVDARDYCGGRWARVETKQSFLNGVVEAMTFGIISPMDVRVVCARSRADNDAADDGAAAETTETGQQPVSPERQN
jgi:hypothetical protein